MKRNALILLLLGAACRLASAQPLLPQVHLKASPEQAVQAVLLSAEPTPERQTVPLPAEPEEEPEDGGSLVPS